MGSFTESLVQENGDELTGFELLEQAVRGRRRLPAGSTEGIAGAPGGVMRKDRRHETT
jgi:hypothetical protein